MVEADLGKKYSPEQIAGRLKVDFPDQPEMQVSTETIYQSLYVQSRGALKRDRQVLVTRQGILMSRTKAINELKSLIVVAPEHLRAQLRGLGLAKLLDRIDRFFSPTGATIEHRVTIRTLRSIAARIRFLINQAAELDVELLVLVPQHPAGPALLAEPGVGPVVAAQLLVSWSHRGRVRNEAAFASLADVAPLEARSGQRTRHRLRRMGDRNLNRALHTVAITRLRCHEDSRNYETRRSAEGKTHPRRSPKSEAHSCLPFLPPHSSRHPPRERGRHARQGGLTT
jgi:transposase